MVEPISTPPSRPRIARAAEDMAAPAKDAGTVTGKTQAGLAAAPGDSVSLSPGALALPAELKEAGPPMDLEIVRRIKEAIAEGKYPIDLEKITESLFQDYMELVN